jgi:hypothetical protein
MLQPKKPVKVVEKKTTKVTTKPKAKTVSQRIGDITLRDVKDAGETALNLSTLGGYGVAKKKVKELTGMKSGGTMKKAKSGAKFDLNKDGKTTFKDVLIGRGVLPKTAKSGAKMKMGGKMAKQAAVAIAMKKAGKKPKKAQTGTAQKQMDSNVSQLAMKNAAGSLMTAGKAKSGKSMKKCKYGCK